MKQVVLCAAALLMAAGTVLAVQTTSAGSGQAYPTRPIRMIVRVHGLPDVKERYAALGIEATSSTPEQFAGYIKSEAANFAKVIKDAGIKVE